MKIQKQNKIKQNKKNVSFFLESAKYELIFYACSITNTCEPGLKV